MARICVYDVAARTGGGLSILRLYHSRAIADNDNEYIFLLGEIELPEGPNVRILSFPWTTRSWLHRVWFDLSVAPRILREERIDSVLSLQNTLIPRIGLPQTVYMHNILPRPLCDVRFSLRKEPYLWVYQNLVGKVIVISLKKAEKVIVQAEWVGRRISNRLGVDPARIRVERPEVFISGCECSRARRVPASPFTFLYPASALSFKNHEAIIEACGILRRLQGDKFRVLFTVEGDENACAKRLRARSSGLPIEFIGWQSKEGLSKLYAECDCLVFPSMAETVGLPLMEAQLYGMPVLASDLDYAHEALGDYAPAAWFDPADSVSVAGAMNEAMEHPLVWGAR